MVITQANSLPFPNVLMAVPLYMGAAGAFHAQTLWGGHKILLDMSSQFVASVLLILDKILLASNASFHVVPELIGAIQKESVKPALQEPTSLSLTNPLASPVPLGHMVLRKALSHHGSVILVHLALVVLMVA